MYSVLENGNFRYYVVFAELICKIWDPCTVQTKRLLLSECCFNLKVSVGMLKQLHNWSRSHPMTQSTTQFLPPVGEDITVLCEVFSVAFLMQAPWQLNQVARTGATVVFDPRKMCSHVTLQHLNLWKNPCSILSINRTGRLNLCTLHQLGYRCQGLCFVSILGWVKEQGYILRIYLDP